MPPHQLARGSAIVRCGGSGFLAVHSRRTAWCEIFAPAAGVQSGVGVTLWCRCTCRSSRSRGDPRRLKSGWNAKLWKPRSKFWNCTWNVPSRILMIEIWRDRFSVFAHGVQRTVHIVHEHAPRARLVAHQHGPRGVRSHVRQRGELDEVHLDRAFFGWNRIRKRISRAVRAERRRTLAPASWRGRRSRRLRRRSTRGGGACAKAPDYGHDHDSQRLKDSHHGSTTS